MRVPKVAVVSMLIALSTGCTAGTAAIGTVANGPAAKGQNSPGEGSTSLAITHVDVVNVVSGVTLTDQTVIIRDGVIAAVGASGEVPIPRGAQIHLARGKTLIPGLWDMHVHVEGAEDCVFPTMLTYGVTNVREMGADQPATVTSRRQALRDGRLLGPDMLVAGPEVESTAGLEAWSRRNNRPWQEVKRHVAAIGSVEDAIAQVRRIRSLGADHIKIKHLCGPPLRALLAEAQVQGIRVVGHAPYGEPQCTEMAADVFNPATANLMGTAGRGYTSIEHHMSFTMTMGNLPEQQRTEVFRRVRRNGTMLTPTFISGLPYAIPQATKRQQAADDGTLLPDVGPTLRAGWREQAEEESGPVLATLLANMERDAQLAYQAGVEMLVGTDLGVITVVPGQAVHDEMAQMVLKLPMRPAEALRAATYNPARATGLERVTGQVARGYLANLVLLDRNPLDDISATREISSVIFHGRLLDETALRELRERTRRIMRAGGQCTRVA